MFTWRSLLDSARCFIIVGISILLLPLTISVTILSLVFRPLISEKVNQRSVCQNQPHFQHKNILVTGVGMAKGLTIARIMYLSGHTVIGADFERDFVPCSGRFSKCLTRFWRLSQITGDTDHNTYHQALLQIIQHHNIDLWISCSGVASAVEDAEAKELIERLTSCKCIQFGVSATTILHEKNTFIEHTKKIGLPVPITYNVESQSEVLVHLTKEQENGLDNRFILKPVGMDDRYRADMTLLPLPTISGTKNHISRLPISKANPWILQQFIPGGVEYCTHALVIDGRVRCFTACPSAELLMHYEALPENDPLFQSMLKFTEKFLESSKGLTGWENLSGHLSFDFMCQEQPLNDDHSGYGSKKKLYAIECNPRAHTAVVLFAQAGRLDNERHADAYLSCQRSQMNGMVPNIVVPPKATRLRYWIGHDLLALILYPLSLIMIRKTEWTAQLLWDCFALLPQRLTGWKEGTFEIWDPLPCLILYHIYWPSAIIRSLFTGESWSRLNVSTTKMFVR